MAWEGLMMSEQLKLIHVEDIHEKHWVGMPEFEMQDLTSHKKLIVHFESEEDFKAFEILIGQSIGKLPSCWYPEKAHRKASHLVYKYEC